MRGLFGAEADEADELFEADEADEADEAARRSRPRVATGRGLTRQRPGGTSQYVTQQQLETAIARVGAQIRTNSNAITQLGTRVSTAATALRRETTDRRNETTRLRSNLSQTQQLTAILPLLTQQPPGSVNIPAIPAGGAPAQTIQVTSAGTSTLSLLLPLLLFTGIGDSGGTGGTGGGGLFGGGDSSQLTTLVLVLALAGGGLGR